MRRNHTHNVARYRKCVKKNVKRRVRLEDVEVQLADQDVVYAIDSPLKPTDGILVIKGNLAPDGAVLKSSGVTIRQHRGPARVFEKEETAVQAILERRDDRLLADKAVEEPIGARHRRPVVCCGGMEDSPWPARRSLPPRFTTPHPMAGRWRKAALSFLGFGLPPDIPSWGGMLSREGRQYMEIAPHLALWPGLCLSVVVYSLNMFGDAVRNLLDLRLRGRFGRYGARR